MCASPYLKPNKPNSTAAPVHIGLLARFGSVGPAFAGRRVPAGRYTLGGHLGRKGDDPPGWQILWLGRRSLRQLVEGENMATQILDE